MYQVKSISYEDDRVRRKKIINFTFPYQELSKFSSLFSIFYSIHAQYGGPILVFQPLPPKARLNSGKDWKLYRIFRRASGRRFLSASRAHVLKVRRNEPACVLGSAKLNCLKIIWLQLSFFWPNGISICYWKGKILFRVLHVLAINYL